LLHARSEGVGPVDEGSWLGVTGGQGGALEGSLGGPVAEAEAPSGVAVVLHEPHGAEKVGIRQAEILERLAAGEGAEVVGENATSATSDRSASAMDMSRRRERGGGQQLTFLAPLTALESAFRRRCLLFVVAAVIGHGRRRRHCGRLAAVGDAAAVGGDGVGDDVGVGVGEAGAEAGLEEARDQPWHLVHRQPVQRDGVVPVDGLQQRRFVLGDALRSVASVGAIGVGTPAQATLDTHLASL